VAEVPDNPAMTANILRLSPAAERNKQPILDVLRALLPERARVLEIASGTGQHAAWFAATMPGWTWQPTDFQADNLPAIAAWVAETGASNVGTPLQLDVMAAGWPLADATFDAIYCANMLHIAPWVTCAALMQGAARHLAPDGLLITYGPYLEDGVPTSPGNQSFDASLRNENPAWGIRRREDVEREAQRAGLALQERHAMPANNLLLVWGREP
jgi:SAM-dependent methyltransferase